MTRRRLLVCAGLAVLASVMLGYCLAWPVIFPPQHIRIWGPGAWWPLRVIPVVLSWHDYQQLLKLSVGDSVYDVVDVLGPPREVLKAPVSVGDFNAGWELPGRPILGDVLVYNGPLFDLIYVMLDSDGRLYYVFVAGS